MSSHRRAAQTALGACRTSGTGWARIRGVRDRAQRNAYARGARTLWSGLAKVAAEGAWVEVYSPAFERFLRHFDTPLSDPVLQAGVDAQRKRLAFNRAAYSFGTCATFNTQLKKVREFKIGGSHGVSGRLLRRQDLQRLRPLRGRPPARRGTRPLGRRATTTRSTPRATS